MPRPPPSRRRGRPAARSAQSASRDSPPTMTAWPSTMPETPRPGMFWNDSTGGSSPTSARAAAAIARAIGCSEACSSAPASRSTSARAGIRRTGSTTSTQRHPSGRHRAGLVEHDRVDRAGRLENLRTADQDAELRAAAGADEERDRRGEPERAGAGDDEHGDGGAERGGGREAEQQPGGERRECDRDDDRHEDARDPVGEALQPPPCRTAPVPPAAPSGRAGCRCRPGSRGRRGVRRR